MAFDPVPLDGVAGHRCIERLPQVLILHRLLVRCLPAALLPVRQPLVQAVHDVLGVGIERHLAGTIQRTECFDDRRQFHAIVGGR